MEIFKNKFLLKLIASVCLFLTLFNFGVTNTTYAGFESVLLKPIVHLFTALADGIVNIIHRVAIEQKQTLLEVEGISGWEAFFATLATVAVVVLAIIVTALVTYFTAGGGAAILALKAGSGIVIGSAISAVGKRNFSGSNSRVYG